MNLRSVYTTQELMDLSKEPSELTKRYSLTEATIKSLKEKGKSFFLRTDLTKLLERLRSNSKATLHHFL